MPSMVSWEVSESQTMGLSALSDKNRAAKDPLEIFRVIYKSLVSSTLPRKGPFPRKEPW